MGDGDDEVASVAADVVFGLAPEMGGMMMDFRGERESLRRLGSISVAVEVFISGGRAKFDTFREDSSERDCFRDEFVRKICGFCDVGDEFSESSKYLVGSYTASKLQQNRCGFHERKREKARVAYSCAV